MMLVRKASCGVVHSGLTERERCGANYREEMKQNIMECRFKNGPPHPIQSGARSALTRCTRSRENMWILQVTVDSVQMMVDRMLRPHALNKRSCGEKLRLGKAENEKM